MIADLLQCSDQGEYLTAPLDARGFTNPAHRLIERRLIETGLFARQRAHHAHFLLLRQILNDAAIALQASQYKRLHDLLEPLRALEMAVAFDGNRIVAPKG